MNKFLVAAVMISAIAALNLARQLAQAPKLLSCDGHSARGNPRHCYNQGAVEAQPSACLGNWAHVLDQGLRS